MVNCHKILNDFVLQTILEVDNTNNISILLYISKVRKISFVDVAVIFWWEMRILNMSFTVDIIC